MRHRWTPEEDKQLLRWVLANRVELGTRDTVRWGPKLRGGRGGKGKGEVSKG
jgi:hypothetical protein